MARKAIQLKYVDDVTIPMIIENRETGIKNKPKGERSTGGCGRCCQLACHQSFAHLYDERVKKSHRLVCPCLVWPLFEETIQVRERRLFVTIYVNAKHYRIKYSWRYNDLFKAARNSKRRRIIENLLKVDDEFSTHNFTTLDHEPWCHVAHIVRTFPSYRPYTRPLLHALVTYHLFTPPCLPPHLLIDR